MTSYYAKNENKEYTGRRRFLYVDLDPEQADLITTNKFSIDIVDNSFFNIGEIN